MYNLLRYNGNYSMTFRSLRNFHRVEIKDSAIENNDDSNKTNNNKTIISKSFEYKTEITGWTPNDYNNLDTEVVVQLKYLNNFWRLLDLPLGNCEIELDLEPWSKESIISEISITNEERGENPVGPIQTTWAPFQINNAKRFVPIVTLSIKDNIKFSEITKQGFKRNIFLEQI